MDPQSVFCPKEHCTARGLQGQETIRIHSDTEGRYRCTTCRGTFSSTTGTAFFRLRTSATVVTLLAHGCPRQAIIAAFELDERTVAAMSRSGRARSASGSTRISCRRGRWISSTCRRMRSTPVVCTPPRAQGPEDADENVSSAPLAPSEGTRRVWQAMAMAVPSRLWLGGVISARRDRQLIDALALRIRACARSTTVLVCVDGLSSYVGAITRL